MALDCLMPPRCPGCGTFVQGEQNLCAACFTGLTFIVAPFCRQCGLPFPLALDGGSAQLCDHCRHRPMRFSARAAFLYDRAAQRLILPFKHADRTELAAILARLMARAGAALLGEADLLVPVPLHPRRLAQRRYNQSALLAAALARSAGRPWVPDALIRARKTAPLGELSAAARLEAVRGAFQIKERARASLVGRRVLLIDDVMTSGATLSACSDALLGAGVLRVDALVAARVPDPRRRETWQTAPALAEMPRRGKSHPSEWR
jgi:ComF family protein